MRKPSSRKWILADYFFEPVTPLSLRFLSVSGLFFAALRLRGMVLHLQTVLMPCMERYSVMSFSGVSKTGGNDDMEYSLQFTNTKQMGWKMIELMSGGSLPKNLIPFGQNT